MFTGIILAVGQVAAIETKSGDMRLTIATGDLPMNDVALGDSIAVNGICLTVIEFGADYFCADVSKETLSRTSLATAQVNTKVNLELALTPSARLGGHIVSGHVDGLGLITERKAEGRSFRFTVKAPDEITQYIAEKGSICIDGISLTVNTIDGTYFSVNIVPHTLQKTTLGLAKVGDKVNLEVDLLARYLERLMKGQTAEKASDTVTTELLKQSGFIN